MKPIYLLLALLLASCATAPKKEVNLPPIEVVGTDSAPVVIPTAPASTLPPVEVTTTTSPATVPTLPAASPPSAPAPVTGARTWKTPTYTSVKVLPASYVEAARLILEHAQTEGFKEYVLKKNVKLTHTDKTLPQAVDMFKEQMDRGDTIKLEFYWNPISSSIGGWNGQVIKQNTSFVKDPIARAGHLLHETTHKYGWTHEGNYYDKNGNGESFPYVLGYAFEDYLRLIIKPAVAAQ